MDDQQTRAAFKGAKMLLFIGSQLVILRRDFTPGIPWPGMLDIPGGAREPGETPETCVTREAFEEVGLTIPEDALELIGCVTEAHGSNWYFAAHLPEGRDAEIVFGDEGLGWQLMAPETFLAAPDAIPHFQRLLHDYLARVGQNWSERRAPL